MKVEAITENLTTQFKTASQQGTGPDIVVWAHDVIGDFIQNSAIDCRSPMRCAGACSACRRERPFRPMISTESPLSSDAFVPNPTDHARQALGLCRGTNGTYGTKPDEAVTSPSRAGGSPTRHSVLAGRARSFSLPSLRSTLPMGG